MSHSGQSWRASIRNDEVIHTRGRWQLLQIPSDRYDSKRNANRLELAVIFRLVQQKLAFSQKVFSVKLNRLEAMRLLQNFWLSTQYLPYSN